MRLWVRITLTISILSIITAISISVFVNNLFRENLDKINFQMSEALTRSISQSILDYVISGNSRKTQEILRRIAKENEEIEYIAIIDFDNKFFSSSVDFSSLPVELQKNEHLNCSDSTRIKKGSIDNHILKYNKHNVYDYSHPFIKNLSAHMHFGLKNSLYKQSIAELNEYSVYVAIIITLIGSLAGYLLSRRISRPIEKLSENVSNFGRTGKYDNDIINSTDKDIIKLISSFKSMLREREIYESEIAEYRDNLEYLVKERTEFLELEIKEHEQTERKLEREKEIADRANNAKSEFMSHMSHELRTPLNAVIGFAQLLELEDNTVIQEYTKEILKAGYHLLAVINDILDLSKIEAGKLELSIEEVNWNSIIDECHKLLIQPIEEKNINFSVQSKENVNFIVVADRVRLKQACLNLISNAVKYNQNSGSVIVSFEEKNGALRVSVKDTGRGIPEALQHKLFIPFERLDLNKDAIDGIGIGLIITQALVNSMNGTIGFKSESGLGSVFWLELPLHRIEKMKALEDKKEIFDIDYIKKKLLPIKGAKKILYIEDNPSNMKVVENIFRKYSNIDFYPAYSPAEAFDILQKNVPDVILMDINLPEMTGYEVKKILDKTPEFKNIKIIGVSANAMQYDINKAMKAGFIDYISKPFEVSTFISVIIKVLESEE